MAAHTGLNSVEDGLVFYYDMDNAKKSFKGKPTTNLVTEPTVAFSNWGGLTGSTVAYLNKEGRQGVRLQTLTSGGVQWYNTGGQQEILPNTQYTVSATIKYSGAIPHPNLFYIRQYTSAGSQTSERGQYTSSLQVPLGGGWYRAYRTFTSDSSATRMLVQGYQYAGGIIIDIEDVQLEQGSFATPFVQGTRSNPILDLTGNYSITPQNLTYNSEGGFEFDGVDDHLDLGSDILFKEGGGWTVESWVKYDTVAGGYNNTTSPANFIGASSIENNSWYWSVLGNKLALWNRSPGVWKYGSTIIQPNVWYNAVLVCDSSGTSYQMYLNGVAEGGDHTTYAWNPAYASLKVRYIGHGNSSNPRRLEGKISETKIYTKSLTAAEVRQNFEASRNKYGV